MEMHYKIYLVTVSVAALITILLFLSNDRRSVRHGDVSHGFNINIKFMLISMLIISIYILALVFIGFRPFDAGFDTSRTIRAFEALEGITTAASVGNGVYGNSEIGFWPVAALLKVVSSEPRWWLVVNVSLVFIFVGSLYKLLVDRTPVPFYIFLFVFLTYDLVYFGNAMRQSSGLPIALISLYFYTRGEQVKYLLFLSVAITLHWSLLAFLLAPLLSRIGQLPRKYLLMFYAILPFFFSWMLTAVLFVSELLGLDVIVDRFEVYMFRNSHIDEVYHLYNFWLVVSFGVFVTFYADKFRHYKMLYLAHSLLLFLVLSGVSIADISERYLYGYIMLIPLIAYLAIFEVLPYRKSSNSLIIVASFYCGAFFVSGLMVISCDSARCTLGY